MESVRQYLLTVIATACVCGIVTQILPAKSSSGKFVKLLCGIFMLVSMISPIAKLDFSDLSNFTEDLSINASEAVSAGEAMSEESVAALIKERSEAYICDKAVAMDLDLEVVVSLDGSSPPVPKTVTLTGELSPYAKSRLSEIISEDLGVSQENQIWT